MKAFVEEFGVHLDKSPTETHEAIKVVKRSHAPLRLAYIRIRTGTDYQTIEMQCLQLPAFAINGNIGRKGLYRVPLVSGAISRQRGRLEHLLS